MILRLFLYQVYNELIYMNLINVSLNHMKHIISVESKIIKFNFLYLNISLNHLDNLVEFNKIS